MDWKRFFSLTRSKIIWTLVLVIGQAFTLYYGMLYVNDNYYEPPRGLDFLGLLFIPAALLTAISFKFSPIRIFLGKIGTDYLNYYGGIMYPITYYGIIAFLLHSLILWYVIICFVAYLYNSKKKTKLKKGSKF